MSVPFTAVVLFDYDAVELSELTIRHGEHVNIVELNESGWCLAKRGEENGWVPSDYVQRLTVPVASSRPASTSSSAPVKHEEINQLLNNLQQSLSINKDKNISSDSNKAGASSVAPSAASSDASSSTAASSGPSVAPSTQTTPKLCAFCNEKIKSAFVMAGDRAFHPQHFTCHKCSQELGGKAYLEKDNLHYCEDCYYCEFSPPCARCQQVIKGPYISALGQSYHPTCFTCSYEGCTTGFQGNQFRKHDDKPYCEAHFLKLFAPYCAQCQHPIHSQVFEALGQKYHVECFVCCIDDKAIGEGGSFHVQDGKIYCPTHFEEKFLQRCTTCKDLIKGQYIKVLDQHFHPACWICSQCLIALKPETCVNDSGKFYCKPCIVILKKKKEQDEIKSIIAPPPAAAEPTQTPSSSVDDVAALAAARLEQQAINTRLKAEADKAAALAIAQNKAYADPATTTYPYELLKDKAKRPINVDPAKKEQYLDDKEFESLFKMNKQAFSILPDWRKKALKTPLLLF